MEGTPAGRGNTLAIILPASRYYCAPRFSEENETNTLIVEFSTHTEIHATPANSSFSVAHTALQHVLLYVDVLQHLLGQSAVVYCMRAHVIFFRNARATRLQQKPVHVINDDSTHTVTPYANPPLPPTRASNWRRTRKKQTE